MLLAGAPLQAALMDGRIVAVADGDTVTLLDDGNQQHRIRLGGIDAPERSQPFGQAARQALAGQVFGQRVQADCIRRDRYQRWVCKLLREGRDINLQLLHDGLAWHYKQYQRDQPEADRSRYAQAEDAARAARTGLWRHPHPQPPWEWRRSGAARRDAPRAEAARPDADRDGAAGDASAAGGPVKLSRNGICHAPGTRYWAVTTRFTAYRTLAACLAAGGRLPR